MKRTQLVFTGFIFLTLSVSAQQKKTAKSKSLPIDTSRFVLVEGGTFNMGTVTPVEPVESPPHAVTVNSFYLAKTETTFDEYDKFCKATGRDTVQSYTWGRGSHPVVTVSWLDAVAYCNWMSESEKLSKYYLINGEDITASDTAKGYRLPTEAEWEFAARGGTKKHDTTYYAGSNNLNEVAWWRDNSENKTHPVAQKKPNELGLYDMNGNVWEWIWDWYDGGYYKASPENNPQGPASGSYRVMRGGAWYNYSNYATVYTRQNHYPIFKQNSVGFRVARSYH